MNRRDDEANELNALEPDLREAVGNFKATVDAWSEAMMSRPREVKTPARINWSAVTKWALGCLVFAGTVSGGVLQNYRQQEVAKIEAARMAEQQRQLAAPKVSIPDDELMANVDSDIAREVPSALQPMASLMTDDSNGN